ncbi:MAG TPA: hypothetical protein PKE55_08010, partial [Kiritimatiellia bacterium]|nr:hypothetical protein [Kiritimatiellia bacterium]
MTEATRRLPFTQAMVASWAGPQVFKEAQGLYERGGVKVSGFEGDMISGEILFGGREMATRGRVLKDGTLENLCPCRDNKERGIICSHISAVAFALVRRAHNPALEQKAREEQRKAIRMSRIDPGDYLKRTGTPG